MMRSKLEAFQSKKTYINNNNRSEVDSNASSGHNTINNDDFYDEDCTVDLILMDFEMPGIVLSFLFVFVMLFYGWFV